MNKQAEIKRILIFNVNWLGDVLFSTAVIRNIRRNFPKSYLACIIPSRCYFILKNNPSLDEIIIYDEKDRHRSLLAKLKFINYLRRKNFDTVFLLHRSFTRALITRLAGIKKIIGYYTKKRGFLLTCKISPPKIESIHRINYYLGLIEKAGLRVEDSHADFYIEAHDMESAENFLKKHSLGSSDFLVVINPGGNWFCKRWPPEYWARLSDMLIENLNARVIISGAVQDRLLAKKIRDLMKASPIIAAGEFNLKQLGGLIKKADLFITADSGPLHIANALNAKHIIAIFGPTSPNITGPYPLKSNTVVLRKDIGCKVPCYVVNCRDNRCMKIITPEEVFQKIKENLADDR
ncbi:MAG: lipopolysaccharide heptosyltransferase II [Candidatus Omnitrophota bacterium]|nr:MAG: lipopolysaccharide heptosyltransferase II [Candidatus Omnitrophota bacterium]